MVAPLNLEEGQSSTRPPHFNGQFYSWWKTRLHDYLMDEDSELWDIVLDGPIIPIVEVKDGEITKVIPKTRQQYNEVDRKKIEKSYRAKKLLAKEIWDSLRTAHKGTEQVKESKVDMLTTQYENFTMKEGESIHDMNTRFSSITNELRSLGEPISSSKQVRKILRILSKSWASKVDAITEAKDLKVLTMDALIGNLKTHEMNRNQDTSKKEAKKDKSLVLKINSGDDSSEEDDMAYLTKRFQKIVRKHGGFKRRGNLPRVATTNDLYHKCGKAGHFIRDCPILKAENKEYQRPGGEKDKIRDLVPKENARKATTDYVVKKALVVWEDFSSESEESECPDDASMLVVQDDTNIFDGMFALMAKSDDEDDEEKLRNLAGVLIDFVIELTTEKDFMNNRLDSLSEVRIVLTVHMSVIMEQVMVLETENLELKEQLSLMIEKSGKGKGEATSLQAELEARGEGSSNQCWFMDSGYSKHMTGSTKNFLSLKALQGGGVSFGDGKKGYILGVGRDGKSLEDSIENVYYVSGLKYSLLSVSKLVTRETKSSFLQTNALSPA
ncbi:uncharacterized protein LOC125829001 [Solanum verrucosum]|uniref:uncharacterized protein LOC125829001 n=1 Tax=Solanum verrucosum TaxID=315347 RepID=UPI0020D010E4|nr:uncharacterized protein LOC125829001 [Solanum verrucosum]